MRIKSIDEVSKGNTCVALFKSFIVKVFFDTFKIESLGSYVRY